MEHASKTRPITSCLAGERGVSSEDFRAMLEYGKQTPYIDNPNRIPPKGCAFTASNAFGWGVPELPTNESLPACKIFWRRPRALLNWPSLMTKRDLPTPA